MEKHGKTQFDSRERGRNKEDYVGWQKKSLIEKERWKENEDFDERERLE